MCATIMKRFLDVFSAPIAMIDGIREKPSFWPPIIAMLLLHAVVGSLHVTLVDHEYYFADLMSDLGRRTPQNQPEITWQGLEQDSITMIVIGQASVPLFYAFFILISAGYLALVSRVGSSSVSFRHWLSVVGWVSVVGAISLLARSVAIFSAPEGRLAFSDANPMNLSNLMGREHPALTVAQFDVTNAWRWALLCLAYKRWTSVSWSLSVTIVLMPILFLYGISMVISP